MEQAGTEQEKIDLRRRIQTEVRKLINRVEIYPLMEDYNPQALIEPGVVQWMHSKFISKVRIIFREGNKTKIRLLLLKGTSEIEF